MPDKNADKPAAVERDWEVLVTWEQLVRGSWLLYAGDPDRAKRRFFVLEAEARAAYMEQLNNNGFLDPGREDIHDVQVELRFKGKPVASSSEPCTPERNAYWLAKAREALANAKGPLFDEKRRKAALGIK